MSALLCGPFCLRVSPGRPLPREPHKAGTPHACGIGKGNPTSGHLGIAFWTRTEGSADHHGRVHQGHELAALSWAVSGRRDGRTGAGVLPQAPWASAPLAPTSLLLAGPLGIL